MPAPDDRDRVAVLLTERPTPETIAAAFGGRVDLGAVRVEQYPKGWVVVGRVKPVSIECQK